MTDPTSRANVCSPWRITPVGAICLGVSLWGCLAVYNATFHLQPGYWFVGRQLLWVALGAVVLWVASGLNVAAHRRGALAAAGVVYAGLWLVLIFGIRINGMRGWFAWHGIFLQPSELGKPLYVLCLAAAITATHAYRRQWWRGYVPVLAVFIVWALPIALQPDFGTLAIYGLTFALLYWCMGGRGLHLALTALAALPLGALILQRHPYLAKRFLAFVDPAADAQGAGWHLIQFQRSLASGGWLGRSWGRGFWSQAYLPLGHSDSIFASTAEAVGFLGVLPIILACLAWAAYGYVRVRKAPHAFAAAVIWGMVILLTGQALIHLSVNLGLLPPTGITLPLISYGGSSLLATLTAVGIVEGLNGRPESV